MDISCVNKSVVITGIDRADTNDLTEQFTMRYRLASDPDIDASYLNVATFKSVAGITMPFFDVQNMPSGTYVVHTYFTSDGSATGTKVTVVISCEDISLGT